MAKTKASQATPEHPLLEPLETIAAELILVRTVLDELRSDVQWAIQNGCRQVAESEPDREALRRSHLPLFSEGDWVDIDDGLHTQSGEIVELDHAANKAWVSVHPTEDVISVSQDWLRKQESDPLSRDDDVQTPESGKLF